MAECTPSSSSTPSSLSTSATREQLFPYSEFKPVSTSRKRQRGNSNRTTPSLRSQVVITLCETLAEGEWFGKCSNLLKEAWGRSSASVMATAPEGGPNDNHAQVRVLCLGLGSPCASKVTRIQLAFLLEACKSLDIAQNAISVCDPIFTREDINLLERLNVKVLDQPDTGAYVLTNPTILFMPHCDLELYESILNINQNKESLSRLFLIGNSLQSYLDNRPSAKLQSIAPCVLRLTPRLTEIPLPASTSWPTAFNNTSIQFLDVAADTDADTVQGAEV